METVSNTERIRVENVHVAEVKPLIPPRALKDEFPQSAAAREFVFMARKTVNAILNGEDKRFLVVIGPCSLHDPGAAMVYAERLKKLAAELDDQLYICMRTYFEKPRTTVGWKGLINDPHLDGTNDLETGLREARKILIEVANMGLPAATEMLDPIVPQYIAELITWASIGARTTESQTHREMASGLSMPVGFKNSTDGNLQVAINAMMSAHSPHHFLGIDADGRASVIVTKGNPYGHVILRGGGGRPNYDAVSVADAEEQLRNASITPRIMVDCSHANCNKKYELQEKVLHDVIRQRTEESTKSLIGVMMESNLKPGRQEFPRADGKPLDYGVSITDPCMGWEQTETVLRFAHENLAAVR
jgi:3-deoxy-7-phosphoheptulonate synthase